MARSQRRRTRRRAHRGLVDAATRAVDERRRPAALLAPHPARRHRHRRAAAPARASHALVIGAGGLGSPVALYLGSAGVGRITIVDDDARRPDQPAAPDRARPGRIGTPKVESARAVGAARSIPTVRVDALARARRRRARCRTRRRRRRRRSTAATTSRPATPSTPPASRTRSRWSPGAAIAFDGQISVYDTRARRRRPATPALFPPRRAVRGRAARRWACSRRWWASSAAMQAAEALKLVVGIGASLAGRLQMLDARDDGVDDDPRPRDPECAVCASRGHASRA